MNRRSSIAPENGKSKKSLKLSELTAREWSTMLVIGAVIGVFFGVVGSLLDMGDAWWWALAVGAVCGAAGARYLTLLAHRKHSSVPTPKSR
jgi:hypothetical protein